MKQPSVDDGLEKRFQNLQVAIYTKSIHKKIPGS